MRLGQLFSALFHMDVSPPPSDDLPDESDILWEQSLLAQRIRRAKELQADVDLEQRNKK